MPTYKIQAIAGQVREYDTQFGPMKSYTLKLEGEMDPVELSQKASTPAPEANSTITGDITEGKFGKKFKKEYNPGGFGGGSVSSPTDGPARPAATQSAPYVRDDSHIKAQWAIGQAVSVLGKEGDINLALVEPLAKDLFAMVDRVKGGSESEYPKATESTPPTSETTTSGSGQSDPNTVLKNLFPDVQPEKGEDPWNPGS